VVPQDLPACRAQSLIPVIGPTDAVACAEAGVEFESATDVVTDARRRIDVSGLMLLAMLLAMPAATAVLSGCACCLTDRGTTTWKLAAPEPGMSFDPSSPVDGGMSSPPAGRPAPDLAGGDRPGNTATGREGSGGTGVAGGAQRPVDRSPADQSRTAPETTIRQRPPSNPRDDAAPLLPLPGPALGALPSPDLAPPSAAPSGLQLDVRGPERVQVGDTMTLEIAVANRSARGATGVRLECEFDGGLAFPEQTERAVTQELGTLAAGATRSITLQLTVAAAGRQCAVVRLIGDGQEPQRQQICVTADEPATELVATLLGPTTRSVGQRAEFVLTVLNRGDRDMEGTRVQIDYPLELAARAASAGASRGAGTFTWELGRLLAQERAQIQVEFEAVRVAPESIILARVESSAARARTQHLLRVEPAPHPLIVSVEDVDDPVAVGEELRYTAAVVNTGAEPIRDWTPRLLISGGIELSQVERAVDGGAPAPLNLRAADDSGVRILDGLPELPAGQSVGLTITARAVREGPAALEVRWTGNDGAEHSTSEPTLVNPPAADSSARAVTDSPPR